jgi:hypothetical protein
MKKLGEDMWHEALGIKAQAIKMAWYTRGSMQYVDVLNLSKDELDQLSKLVDSNMETTKKTKLPFF